MPGTHTGTLPRGSAFPWLAPVGVLVNHGFPEDLLSHLEPGPPLIRITQQNPGIRSSAGVLIICAGSDPAARIGTVTPEYGALGLRPGSAARGTFCRAADVNWEGHVIIRPLNRVNAVAAVPDGGSDATVITAKHVVPAQAQRVEPAQAQRVEPAQAQRVEPAQLELSCRTGANGYQIVSVTGELDIATAEQAYSYISEVIDGRPAPVTVDLSGLTFCDASGLGALARIARHARRGRPPAHARLGPAVAGEDHAYYRRRPGLPRAAPVSSRLLGVTCRAQSRPDWLNLAR